MIVAENKIFLLNTLNTTYAFRVMDTGHLEHLYYGKRIHITATQEGIASLIEKSAFAPGNTITYDAEHPDITLEDKCLEVSGYGRGDVREPAVVVVKGDGSSTTDFVYVNHSVKSTRTALETLPYAIAQTDEADELTIYLTDSQYDVDFEIRYTVFEKTDVITRNVVITNHMSEDVKVRRVMSTQVDFHDHEFVMSTFSGGWAREMNKVDIKLSAGKYSTGSMTGTSSNRNNPLVILARENTTQDSGDCYGFNLVYSGNHYECADVSSFGKLRFVSGIQPEGFEWCLKKDEMLETPEAVMAFSSKGYNGLSQCMHSFVRNHIVRGSWKNKIRPILLNSWEAAYFDINESKLLKLAKAAAKVGIELFVMDDGWFGARDDDTQSLGDWQANTKKLPGGLKGLCDKIKDLGMDFGIWVEPEMINVKSKLYEQHPDWCLDIEGKAHSEGRNQRVLDLCKPDVQDFIIKSMSDVLGSADISYVKWDMNRIISDYFSKYLESNRQGEVAHRYVLGLYRVFDELTKKFPDVLFEGCASGGNRFDLGILCYFPQIWGSDNTDALCRAQIQTGYSYGYPLETVGSHVSGCPNHQTLRETPLDTRFNVAAFGSLGYECNLCDMGKEELEAVSAQIDLYKEIRNVTQYGTFYRGRTFDDGNICEWTVVSEEGRQAIGMIMQKLVSANSPYLCYFAKGLNADKKYHFTNKYMKHNIKEFGDLVNTVSPVHIKQDSLVHNVIAKVIKMDGEKEDYHVYGDALCESGVRLSPGFGAVGYDDRVRYFPDFGSRMYFMKEEE